MSTDGNVVPLLPAVEQVNPEVCEWEREREN